jgi:hypothetical protein
VFYCNCQAAKTRVKLYDEKVHNIVRQFIETGIISMDFVRSERNLVDPLTKPLAKGW